VTMSLFRIDAPAALLAGLLFTSIGQSGPPGKSAEVKVQEAAALKDAYILMAMGDHDYDGHRVKAMHHVAETIKLLDHSVMKNGNKGEKIVATEEEISTARAAYIAKHEGKKHEGQAQSDAQMREALQLLGKVREAVAQHKHPKVKENVGEAIKHVEIALKVR
jgi:hypothetical protein